MQKIPFSAAQSEFTEKRSCFIGQVWPVSSEEEAQERIRSAKKKYHDARHNCWCYILGDTVLRYSDDGEPQGTAGQPMLNVFQLAMCAAWSLGISAASCWEPAA